MIKNNKNLISIIMPVYNSEKYISEAIDSVCNQSYTKWELIIVNDGSTDSTPEIIDEYSKRDCRIKVFRRKNEGVSAARNFALDNICGEYVTFIDSDDIYHIDRLKIMLQIFEQNPKCGAVFAGFKTFNGSIEANNEAVDVSKTELIEKDILKTVISDTRKHFVWNVMLKSEIAKSEKFVPLRFAEDFCYSRDCARHFKQIAALDDVLYYYRRDNVNSMTSNFFAEKYIPDYMELVENIYGFCKKYKLNDNFYKKIVAHEYAQNSMRIRKSTSYKKFVECMNNRKFREGIEFADASQCTLFEKLLFYMVSHRIYILFLFWVW